MKTHAYYKDAILKRIEWINELTQSNYTTNYCSLYGGWELYREDEQGRHYRGALGFHARKTSVEMLEYLNGLYEGLMYPFYTK